MLRLAALAGGVGAARMLCGLSDVMAPTDMTVVVNTGDDLTIHGLRVCPDIDTVTYALAGAIDAERAWGLTGETWAVMAALDRYPDVAPPGSRAGHSWFRLGDRDLATHLYRTQRLAEEGSLSDVTAEIARAWDVQVRLIPMSDQRVETRVTVPGPEPETSVEIGFQDYFVRLGHAVPVQAVRFAGIDEAEPAAGVLESIGSADQVLICPSNPIVSIGPILAVPGVGEAVAQRRRDVVAVSPIIAGTAVRGPADRLMTELGHEASVAGVAHLYTPFASTLVVDEADADMADAVGAEGMRCIVTPTLMTGPAEASALARAVLRR
ncbi:MAG: 2-phospho-L-lactate transferase [Actinomycetota bacterium]|nr:2-phospho-L-lactate transferase [Actinomycetota bacterium]